MVKRRSTGLRAGAFLLTSSLGAQGLGCAGPAASVGIATPSAPGAVAPPKAPTASVYPTMAPLDRYREKTPADEIALARSAAPASISADAEVLVLGERGYEVAVPGKNGFTCFVERSWASGLEDAGFWNPRIRSPNCFNAQAVRSELRQLLKRTEWVLAGATREQLVEKTRAAIADHTFAGPEPGALSFMMSKSGYLNDDVGGPWLPHVMLFVAHGQAATFGAGLKGSPVLGQEGTEIESTVLFIPVRRWSDGSPAPALPEAHVHAS